MYVKLFSSILTSSVWAESNSTRIVWIAMLALADKDGDVRASPSGLARLANVTTGECQEALARFLAPDPESGTPDDDGRRIEQCAGGWHILNYTKYRTMHDAETRKAQWREGTRKYRAGRKEPAIVNKSQQPSTASQHESTRGQQPSAHTEAEAEADAEKKTTLARKTLSDDPFSQIWPSYPRRAGSNSRKAAYTAFCARVREGVGVGSLGEAVERYATFCKATGKVGTEFVQQGQRFFGPDGGWRELWITPAAPAYVDKLTAGRSALAGWLASQEAAEASPAPAAGEEVT